MHDLTVTCFGVGDGSPCADRGHSSFLYELPGATFLIDCGEPVSGRFKASGRSYDAVDRILISHMHFDHTGGLFMLLQGFWLEKRARPLPIHLPAHGIEPVRQLLKSACIFDELLPFKLHLAPLNPQAAVTQGNIRVTPFPTTHLDGFRKQFGSQYPGCYEAFSFLIETPKLRIAHSADIGSVADLEPLLERPLNLLVVEVAHFKPEELFDRLGKADIERVVFVHLGRPHWESPDAIKRQATAMLPKGNFVFAGDQETLAF